MDMAICSCPAVMSSLAVTPPTAEPSIADNSTTNQSTTDHFVTNHYTISTLIKISRKFFVIFREGIGCKVIFD